MGSLQCVLIHPLQRALKRGFPKPANKSLPLCNWYSVADSPVFVLWNEQWNIEQTQVIGVVHLQERWLRLKVFMHTQRIMYPSLFLAYYILSLKHYETWIMTCQVRPYSSIMVAAHLTNKDININIMFKLWYLHVPWKSWLLISQYIIPVSGFLTTCLQVCVDFSPPHPVCSVPINKECSGTRINCLHAHYSGLYWRTPGSKSRFLTNQYNQSYPGFWNHLHSQPITGMATPNTIQYIL